MAQLTLKDRLVLSNTLPMQGNFIDLICREDILKKVSIKQEEIAQFEIKVLDTGGLGWSEDKVKDTTWDVEFSEAEKTYIKSTLTKLSDENKLTVDHVAIYKLFVS